MTKIHRGPVADNGNMQETKILSCRQVATQEDPHEGVRKVDGIAYANFLQICVIGEKIPSRSSSGSSTRVASMVCDVWKYTAVKIWLRLATRQIAHAMIPCVTYPLDAKERSS